jgi:Transmembrane domain of unknown function (DUF3566)
MSQPPHAGAPAVPSTDFGPATVSGTPTTERKDHREAGGNGAKPAANERAATPLVTGKAAPSQTTTHIPPVPAPQGAPQPGPQPGPLGASGPLPHTPGPVKAPSVRGPRRAKLQLRHINPWTVLKFSCVLSIALFFVWLIAIGILFGILDAAGVIKDINDTVVQLNGPGSKPPVTAGIVFGGAAIIGVVDIVLFIALTTIGAVIYNLCADLVGGIEVTLSER